MAGEDLEALLRRGGFAVGANPSTCRAGRIVAAAVNVRWIGFECLRRGETWRG
jgi:hypothetical protein